MDAVAALGSKYRITVELCAVLGGIAYSVGGCIPLPLGLELLEPERFQSIGPGVDISGG